MKESVEGEHMYVKVIKDTVWNNEICFFSNNFYADRIQPNPLEIQQKLHPIII